MNLRNAFLFIFFTIVTGCKSQGDGNSIQSAENSAFDKECTRTIKLFFKEIESNKYNDGLETLLRQNPGIDFTDSTTINLREQFSVLNKISGKYNGNTFLRKKLIGEDVGAYSYLAKYDKKYYRFLFVFYNTEGTTRIFKFKFDDSITQELEESLRIYF